MIYRCNVNIIKNILHVLLLLRLWMIVITGARTKCHGTKCRWRTDSLSWFTVDVGNCLLIIAVM